MELIILDTNVLSELMRPKPEPRVLSAVDAISSKAVWTTTITVFEVRFGLSLLDHGRRRSALTSAFDALLQCELEGRVLAFDQASAERTAEISAQCRKLGRTVDLRDSMIAGIAAAHEGVIWTRNVSHFAYSGISIFNPWERSGTGP